MIVSADSNVQLICPSGCVALMTGEITIETIKRQIGAKLIEIVECSDGGIMIIDESGKLKGLPWNIKATLEYKYAYHDGKLIGKIVGKVVKMPRPVFEAFDNDYAEE